VLAVTIEQTYFNGDGYLVCARFKNNRAIYFNHPIDVQVGTQVKLALKKYQ